MDPIAARRVVRSVPTFAAMADEVIATRADQLKSETSKPRWRVALGRHGLHLRPLPVDRVGTEEVLKVLQPLWLEKPEMAKTRDTSRPFWTLRRPRVTATAKIQHVGGAPRPPSAEALEQVEAFEREGWDVTDGKRRPLRTFGHFNRQLWLAVRGVAGRLPFQADAPEPDDWGNSMAADAKRFRKR